MEQHTLEVRNLSVSFFTDSGERPAVRDVSLQIPRGSITGIVGESGCGKSVTARAVIGLIREPGPRVTGCTGRNKLNCRKPLPLGSGFVFYPDRRMRPFPAGQLLFLQHAVLRRQYSLQPEHYHSVKFAFTQAGQQIYRHSSVLPAGGGKR